ncbi:MAG: sigma 54-interacting transcriptional regulator [Planctomycetes bacterium]|nr:sigma 54-interacting transcriptional regulator [Planctomycetota bacterium]
MATGPIAIGVTFLAGKDAGQERTFRLRDGERVTIGRGAECEITLWDESASRRHATIERTGGDVVIADLGSANGIQVNGETVRRATLRAGDRLRIGTTELRFETRGFRDRPTAVLPLGDDAEDGAYTIASSLPRDSVRLGERIAADSERGRRLEQLLALVEAVQHSESGEGVHRAVIDCVLAAFPAARAVVVPCAFGTRTPLWSAAVMQAADGAAAPFSRGVVERVLAEGNALLAADAAADPATRARESIAGRGVRSIAAVPLAAREEIVGVLYLEAPAESAAPFTEQDLAYAATIGQVAGMALASAERLQHSRRVLANRERLAGDVPAGDDARFREVLARIATFAAAGGPLLIRGETGTGKELLARHAHRAGPFADGPWIPVNCAAIPPPLLESELFGHERGAFTGATGRKEGFFEIADRGTLFLDEIGDLPIDLQPKLLRVLESGEFFRVGGHAPVRVRLLIVSATHRPIEEYVAAGRFREDLLFRLNRFPVTVPPLRERRADIVPLARRFLEEAARRAGGAARELSPAAAAALEGYDWPGNVRELRNAIERAVVLAQGEIVPEDLALALPRGEAADPAASDPPPPRSIAAAEAEAIRAALRHTLGRKQDAAALLGISLPTLRRKLKAYEIVVLTENRAISDRGSG